MAGRLVAGREGMGLRRLGPVLLGLALLGLVAGRVHAQTAPPASVPALTAQGIYANQAEHWGGHWQLERRGRQVTATLTTARSPVSSPAVLFRVPPGFRPARTVTQREKRQLVDGEGQFLEGLGHHYLKLQVARDGTVRYVDNAPRKRASWVRYRTTLAWTTDEAACSGGVLHGRTQALVDALEAQTGLACAAISPTQLAAVTALDLRGRTLAGLRAGDLAGLGGVQTLYLSALPAGLLVGLGDVQTLYLGPNRLEASPAGLSAGRAARRGPAQTALPAPAPVLTAEGPYAHRTEHWIGRWHLVRQGREVTATLATARSPVAAPSVLFRVPPGFRPARTVAQTVAPAWPVDGQGRTLVTPVHRLTLQVTRDGAVRYVDDAPGAGVGWVRYETTLVWFTDEADCGGGVLHGRTQEVVDILEAQTGLACAAISPMQLAAVTALDLRGRALAGLRAGDLAGLGGVQTLYLGDNGPEALPAELLARLGGVQTLYLGDNGLGILPAGLSAGWTAGQAPDQSAQPASVPVATARGTYAHRGEHWDGHWRLERRGQQVAATLGTVRSPVPHSAQPSPTVLFRMPPGFRPARTVTTWRSGWPVDGQGQSRSEWPRRELTLQVARDGTVRYVDDTPIERADWVRYEITLSWDTDEAECGGGVLHGRAQALVDALEAQMGLACAAIGPAQLAAVTALNLRSHELAGLRTGDMAGLVSLQSLDLSRNELSVLPAGLFEGLVSLQSLDLGHNELSVLPAGLFEGLVSLQSLDLGHNELSVLPAGLFEGLVSLQSLDLDYLSLLPTELFEGLVSLQSLDLGHNELSVLPAGLFEDLDSLQSLDLGHNELLVLPAGLFEGLDFLQSLDLGHNGLSALPVELFEGLDSLQSLDLRGNGLSALPAGLLADLVSLLLAGLDSLQSLGLGHNGLAAGQVHLRNGYSAPALTAEGAYVRRTEHWDGHWHLVRRGRQVTATLATARSPVASPAVLFRVPPGFRPARPVTQTVTPAWPVDGTGQTLVSPARNFALQVARDGTVRYVVEAPGDGVDWVRYKATLAWLTDEADCGGGVLHGRTQEVVDALVAQTGLACAAIGPAQLAAVTALALPVPVPELALPPLPEPAYFGAVAHPLSPPMDVTVLDLHGYAMPGLRAGGWAGLRAGDLAGLVSLQSLDLSGRGRAPLPAELFAGLVSLQSLDLSDRGLPALPAELFAGLVSLQSLDLSGNGLTALPAELFAGLVSLQHLDLSGNGLTALPVKLLGGLPALQSLDLDGNGLSPEFLSSVQRLGGSDRREELLLPAPGPLLRSRHEIIGSLLPDDLRWLAEEVPQVQSLTLEVKDLQSLPADFLAEVPQVQSLRLTSWSLTALPADFLADTPHLHTLDLFLPNLAAWPEGLLTEGHARLQRVTLELHPQTLLPPHLLAHMPRLAQVELRGEPRALPAGFLAYTSSLRALVLPPTLEAIGPGTLAGTGLVDFALRTEADQLRGPTPGETASLTLGVGFLAGATHLRTFSLWESRGLDALHLPPDFLADLPHLSAVLLDAPLPLPLPLGFLRGAQLQALQLYLRLPADAAPLSPLPALVQAQHLLLDLACDTAYPPALFRDWPRQETLTLRPCWHSLADPAARAAFLQTVPAAAGLHLNRYSDLPRTAYAHLPVRTLALGVDTDTFTGWVPAAPQPGAPQPGAAVAVRAGPGWEHPVVGWRPAGAGPPAPILDRVQAQGEWWRIPHDFLAGLPLQTLHLFPAGEQAHLSRAAFSRGSPYIGPPWPASLHTNPHLQHLTLETSRWAYEEPGLQLLDPTGPRLRLDWLQIIGENLPDRLRPDFLRPHRVPILFLDWNSGRFSEQSSDAWLRTLVAAWPPALRHLVLHTHLSVLDGHTYADRMHRTGRLRDGRGLTSLVRTLPAGVDCLHLVLPGMARPLPDALRTAAVRHGLSLQVQATASPALPPDRILPAAAMRSFFEIEHRPWTQARACERSLLAIDPQVIYLRISGIRPSMGNFRAPDWTLPADLLDRPGSLRHVRIDFDPQQCPDCRAS